MTRTRTEGDTSHDAAEQARNHYARLEQVYVELGVPPEDAHEYAHGVAPQGA